MKEVFHNSEVIIAHHAGDTLAISLLVIKSCDSLQKFCVFFNSPQWAKIRKEIES